VTKTLAYYGTHLIAAVKGFMIQAVAEYCPKSKKIQKDKKIMKMWNLSTLCKMTVRFIN